jgi:hypothetical protein
MKSHWIMAGLIVAAARLVAAPVGYLTPRRSADTVASPWGVQAGDNERVTLFDRAGELGVKWTRFLAVWPTIEREKGRYDFSSLDEPVNAARAHGITPFVCISNGNKLYSGTIPNPDPNWRLIYGVKPAPPILDDAAMAAWLRYVDAVIAHAKDRVTHWEIWNEPNHYAYWGGPPDAASYGKLVRLTAARIRAAQPDASPGSWPRIPRTPSISFPFTTTPRCPRPGSILPTIPGPRLRPTIRSCNFGRASAAIRPPVVQRIFGE